MIFDTEMVIDAFKAIFQSDLNAEIGLINTEKSAAPGSDLYLEDIPNDTYLFQAITPTVNNYNVFLMYGLEGGANIIDSQDDNYIEPIQLSFEIVLPDAGDEQRENQIKKLLRYSRALRSIVIKNPDILQGYGKIKIKSLTPSGFGFGRSIFLSCGIQIITTITAR